MAKKPNTIDPEVAKLLGDETATPPVVQPTEPTEPDPAEPAVTEPTADEPAPIAEPATVEVDTVLDAHLRRQETWEEDAKKLFRGPTEQEKEREELLNELSKFDLQRDTELRKAAAEKEAAEQAEQEAARKKRIAELEAELKSLKKAS